MSVRHRSSSVEDGADENGAHEDSSSQGEENPAWYTPRRLLALFCIMQVIASTGVKGAVADADTPASGYDGEFNLSNSQDGALYSAFMVGLLVGSPMFAEASKHFNPFRIICVGLSAWIFSTSGCALAPNFPFFVFVRMTVGLGEASFCALGAPFIDDAAPAGRKTQWLAVFFMMIPVGVASGFILGKILGDALGWRFPFAFLALLMIPFAAFTFVAKPISLRGGDSKRRESGAEEPSADPYNPASARRPDPAAVARSFLADIAVLARIPTYVMLGVAWAMHTATIGCFSYYGPKAAKELFQLDAADSVFGALTVVTGIMGTLMGGMLLDRWNASVYKALTFCAFACSCGFVLMIAAFRMPKLSGFIPLFALGEVALFSINAVANAATMWTVPLRLRSLACALVTITIHVLGDVPAPPIVGKIQDNLNRARGSDPNNWRTSLSVIVCALLVAVVLFGAGAWVSRRDSLRAAAGESGEDPTARLLPSDAGSSDAGASTASLSSPAGPGQRDGALLEA